MRILLDQGTPTPLRGYLSQHEVSTTFELQWSELTNGELLERAESANFQIFITTDQNLKYQQNLSARRISILVICSTSWLRIERHVGDVMNAVDKACPGSYAEVRIP